jgi:hypothetical protein
MYVAGLLLGTGASLAVAGPASAAVSDGWWDPSGNNYLIRSSSTVIGHDSYQNLDLIRQDNRSASHVGLINVGNAQGDNSGSLGVIGGIVKKAVQPQ